MHLGIVGRLLTELMMMSRIENNSRPLNDIKLALKYHFHMILQHQQKLSNLNVGSMSNDQ